MEKELGKHYLIELVGCDDEKIRLASYVQEMCLAALEEGGVTILNNFFHQFEPDGVSGVILITESHFTIHTWPNEKYAAVDIFTCSKNINIDAIINKLKKELGAKEEKTQVLARGF